MSEFFINRPIFAWVLAVGVMLAGILSITQLPIAQFPNIAPPQVVVSATYPGANAQVLESSVTQVIEQQLSGLDHLLYFQAQSNAAGTVQITLTFQQGTNPDTAQVQTQNVVNQANSRLPTQVQQRGLTVTKANADFLILVGVADFSDRTDSTDVGDWIVNNLQYPLQRQTGIGQAQLFGSGYAMRIWLNPYKLAAVQLMPSDVAAAIQSQNIDVSAGQVGAFPLVNGADLNAIVASKSRLSTPEQFRNIVVKTQPNGAVIKIGDVARVEMGADNYSRRTRYNGHPAAALALQLAPGADALKTASAVKTFVKTVSNKLPPGYQVFFVRDTTSFITLSVTEVLKTLGEAVVLVIIVMLVFLQDWRTTLIPAIAVPVVLLGTFGVLAIAGYSINTLTLFGMVLSIGLLVDDAIVVVENVERIMREEDLPPKEATSKSMKELGSALVGIAMVLSAVLLPMAFFPGSTGVIYKQFSITIVSAMALSVLVALILTPALCATILRPAKKKADEGKGLGARFNRWFGRMTEHYVHAVEHVIHRRALFLLIFAGIVALLVVLFVRLPTSYIPNEDQGNSFVLVSLPPGAVQTRTDAVEKEIQNHYLSNEKKDVSGIYLVSGVSFAGAGPNQGIGFAVLAPFDQRTQSDTSVNAINARAQKSFAGIRDAQITPISPPAVNGLGRSNGFTFELLNSGALSREDFVKRRDQLLAMAGKNPQLTGVRLNTLAEAPQLQVTMDDAKLAVFGLTQTDVNSTLSAAWGGQYINDFLDRGQVKRVYIQGDSSSRMLPEDLSNWYVRASGSGSSSASPTPTARATTTAVSSSAPAAPSTTPATALASGAGGIAVPSASSTVGGTGGATSIVPTTMTTMVPLTAIARTSWTVGASQLTRFQGVPSYEFQGTPAPGVSSGQAMQAMVNIQKKLAPGTSVAWSELSYQEQVSSGQGPILFGLSALVVFLCLAALYESWTIPFAVLLVVPLGLIGAVALVTLRGLDNNIYFQVGLLTTMGLAAKNAILIVEFAEDERHKGSSPCDSAVKAARLRLRPILMTSLAFIAGTFPLAIASGAGANSRIAIGTAVVGGMVTATALAIFFVPMFFLAVAKLFHRDKAPDGEAKDEKSEKPKNDEVDRPGADPSATPQPA